MKPLVVEQVVKQYGDKRAVNGISLEVDRGEIYGLLRAGVGSPALWEVLVSLVEMLISIWFFGWLSAKIYRTGVLLYGKRPSIRELRKAMGAFKV